MRDPVPWGCDDLASDAVVPKIEKWAVEKYYSLQILCPKCNEQSFYFFARPYSYKAATAVVCENKACRALLALRGRNTR